MTYEPKIIYAPVAKGIPVDPSDILEARDTIMAARGYAAPDVSKTLMLLLSGVQTDKTQSALGSLAQFEADLAHTLETNTFNTQLVDYRKAVNRLAQYRKADGRPEQFETREAGYDENGDPITEQVSVSPAIDPLPAQIEVEIRDDETGEVTGTVWIDNPEIVQDDAQRAVAQAVIDATPDAVKNFTG